MFARSHRGRPANLREPAQSTRGRELARDFLWCEVVQVGAEFARGFDRTGVHVALPRSPSAARRRSLGVAFGGKQPVGAPIKTLLRALRAAQMPDQFAGRAIDIDPFQSVEFFAHEVEHVRTAHHANLDAIAIENIGAHDRPPIQAPEQKLRFLGSDSQINCAICPSADLPARPEIPQAPSASDASGWPFHHPAPRPSGYRSRCEICEGGALSLRGRRSRLHGKAQLDQAADGFGARCIIRPGRGGRSRAHAAQEAEEFERRCWSSRHPYRSVFGCSCGLRPPVEGSALGDTHFRGHNAFTFVTAR